MRCRRPLIFESSQTRRNRHPSPKATNIKSLGGASEAQRDDGLLLNVELIETENVLWAEQYDRKSSDLISLQNEIARDVSAKLRSCLSGDARWSLGRTWN